MLDDLQENASLNDTVDTLIEFARKRALLEELLKEVAAYNPQQYERFSGRLRSGGEGHDGA